SSYTAHSHPFPTRRSSDLTTRWAWNWTLAVGRPLHTVPVMTTAILTAAPAVTAAVRPRIMSRALALVLAANVGALTSLYLLLSRSEEHTSELQSRGHLVCR